MKGEPMPNGVINKVALKALILERARVVRPTYTWTRVAIEECAAVLKARLVKTIDAQLRALPSVGKTIRFQHEA